MGDYVDRGAFSLEVLFVLFSLKIANPDQVCLLRGDHEMPLMQLSKNGFVRELKKKFQLEWWYFYETLAKLFNFLPCALFINVPHAKDETNAYMQFCHGGLELSGLDHFLSTPASIRFSILHLGFPEENLNIFGKKSNTNFFSSKNIFPIFLKKIEDSTQKKLQQFINLIRQQQLPLNLMNGFMWNDFVETSDTIDYLTGRGFTLNEHATRSLLDLYSNNSNSRIFTMFRGHQHSAGGYGLLWDLIYFKGLVGFWKRSNEVHPNDETFNIRDHGALVYSVLSSPASSLLFSVDSVVEIFIEDHNTWKMKHHVQKVKSSFKA